MTQDDTLCPIARAAAVIGDAWTLLILRELRLGNDRFDGIQAQTGISSHLLVSRLRQMEADGLISREPYAERPRRYAYRLTSKARELDGMMLLLRQWGMRHCGLDPTAESAVTMVHRRTGALVDAEWHVPEADAPFSFSQLDSRLGAGWAAERAAREAEFTAGKRERVKRRSKGAGVPR